MRSYGRGAYVADDWRSPDDAISRGPSATPLLFQNIKIVTLAAAYHPRRLQMRVTFARKASSPDSARLGLPMGGKRKF